MRCPACALVLGGVAFAFLTGGCDTTLAERDGSIQSDASVRDGGSVDGGAFDSAIDGGFEPGRDSGALDGGMPDAPPPPPTGRVIYPADREHSPVTPDLAEGLRSIAMIAGRNEQVLSRVGDSITRSTAFLNCFAGSSVNLDGRTALEPTIAHFNGGRVASVNPFTRASLVLLSGNPFRLSGRSPRKTILP